MVEWPAAVLHQNTPSAAAGRVIRDKVYIVIAGHHR